MQIESTCQQGQNPGRDGCVAADGSKGTGKKAFATANVTDGKVTSVEVTSSGNGYTSTPDIIIEKPNF